MYSEIQKKIFSLPPNKQLLFGVSCIKRINIRIEEYLVNPKNLVIVAYLNKLIDEVFIRCSLEQFDKINDLISIHDSSLLDQLIPDTDEDGSNEIVLLRNTIIGVAYCLDFIRECNCNYICYCSMKAIETVDVIALGIQNLSSSDLSVSKELAIQNAMLDAILDMGGNLERIKEFISQFKMEV